MRKIIASHLTDVIFDSAALGGTAVVSHPLAHPGEWQALLSLPHARLPAQTVLVRREGSGAMAAIEPDGEIEHRLIQGGQVRLRAPDHFGFAVRLRSVGADAPEWDSRRLQKGDYFACLPLRPGSYRLANLLNQANAEVVIHYPDPRTRDPAPAMEPVRVRAGEQFSSARVGLFPGQPLIVAIDAPAHLTLVLETPDDGPSDLAAWRERRDFEALAALGRKKTAPPVHQDNQQGRGKKK